MELGSKEKDDIMEADSKEDDIIETELYKLTDKESYRLHKTILGQCYRAATYSPDRSTQIGSVIVDASGLIRSATMAYNGFVEGWEPIESDYERPRKYQLTAHSERRSIYRAAKNGVITEGGTLYSTWAACDACAIAIVEAGLVRLVRHHPPEDDAVQRWLESVSLGDEILKNCGVEIIDVQGPIYEGFPILRGGEIFDPSR